MSGVANLFDVAMVFAVGLMIAIVSAYHFSEIFSAEELAMIKNPNQPAKIPTSSVSLVAILIVIGIVALIGRGLWKGMRRQR